MTAYSNFEEIPPLRYELIMADPPWDYENWSPAGEGKNAKSHYKCLPLEALKSMPVNQLAARDCVLWLWATNPMLPQALELMNAWGFRFVTAGSWAKLSPKSRFGEEGAKQHMGPGYVLRGSDEPYLIGKVGQPSTFGTRIRSTIIAPVRDHSRKPDEAYVNADILMPGARRLDLFSRQERPGWDCFGNETGKFAAVT